MILALALLNGCVGAYLIWFALHSDDRAEERGVLATGVLLLIWASVVGVLSGRHDIPAGASEWWTDVTAPQATLIAALGVGIIGGFTILQKLRNDRRDQWWKRTQWAIDLTLIDEERSQIVGWAALAELSASEPATRQDRLLLRQVVDAALDEVADAGEIDDTDEVVIEDGGDNEDLRDEDGHLAPDDR